MSEIRDQHSWIQTAGETRKRGNLYDWGSLLHFTQQPSSHNTFYTTGVDIHLICFAV